MFCEVEFYCFTVMLSYPLKKKKPQLQLDINSLNQMQYLTNFKLYRVKKKEKTKRPQSILLVASISQRMSSYSFHQPNPPTKLWFAWGCNQKYLLEVLHFGNEPETLQVGNSLLNHSSNFDLENLKLMNLQRQCLEQVGKSFN